MIPNLGYPGGSAVKNLPTMQEMLEIWVQSLGWEDLPEKGMEIHSNIFAQETPWTEEAGKLVYGVTKSWTCFTD